MTPTTDSPRRRRRPAGGHATLAKMSYRPSPEIREALDAESEREGLSKTIIIEDALRRRYKLNGGKR